MGNGDATEAHVAHAVTAGLAAVSLLASSVIIYLVVTKWRHLQQASPLLAHFAVWVSAADVLRSVWALVSFTPSALGRAESFYAGSSTCTLLGALQQGTMLATVGWYLIAALMALRLARGESTSALKKAAPLHHLTVWGGSVLLAVLPAVSGQMAPVDSDRDECWIRAFTNVYRLSLMVPLGLALLVAAIMCVFAGLNSGIVESRPPLARLVPFSAIFLVLWTPMLALRMDEFISNRLAQDWLVGVAMSCAAATGIANATRLLLSYPLVELFRKGRMAVQPVRGAQSLRSVNDLGLVVDEKEPLQLYFNRADGGDEV